MLHFYEFNCHTFSFADVIDVKVKSIQAITKTQTRWINELLETCGMTLKRINKI